MSAIELLLRSSADTLLGPQDPLKSEIIDAMKTISVAVSSEDYDEFRREAKRQNRSIAQLIREAMADYRTQKLSKKTPLTELPVLAGHRARTSLPEREELYDG